MKFERIQSTLKNGKQLVIEEVSEEVWKPFSEYCLSIFQSSDHVITQADEYSPNEKESKDWINNFLKSDKSLLLMATIDDFIVGNIDFSVRENRRRVCHRGEIGMSVHKDYRSIGVGQVLLKRLIDYCKSREDILKIELGVIEENEPARKLYEKFGFQEEGIRKKSIKRESGSFSDEIRMALFV